MNPISILTALLLGASVPPAPKHPVTDTYHGVAVVDDYRWLEDAAAPEVKVWSEAQNTAARAYLDALPSAAAVRARVDQIMTAPSVRFSALRMAGGRLLAMRREPTRQQPILVAFDNASAMIGASDAAGPARVLLDPEVIDPSNHTTIDWYVPSPDGKLIAVSLSAGGSESGDVHLYTIADGKPAHEIVPRVNGGTAGGSLAWAPDTSGFYYTRYPRAGERASEDMDFYTQVYFHKLGTDGKDDRYEVGKDFPRIAEILLESHESNTAANGTILASVQKGDGGEFMHFLRDPNSGKWTQVTRYEDRVVQAALGSAGDDAVYLISRKDAPRGKMMRLDLAASILDKAKTIVPEGPDTLVSEFADASNLIVTDHLVFATYQLGGPSELRVFSHDGKAAPKPEQPPVAAVGGLTCVGGDKLLYNLTSFIQSSTWYAFEPSAAASRVGAISTQSPVDFSAYEAVREMATSKDGTQVPVNIIRKKGLALDGSHPCHVNGYGGYNINIEPRFSPADVVLLEQGFVLAVANIRGGGEFGEAWHRAGNLENKQNVFDDFAAACKLMIDRKYTSPQKLAIEGGSNGGLLMGAELTQHPEMFKTVVSHVGIYDMLRVELSSNGAFNVPEFGTVKEEKLFKAMYAYSPYHHVKDGVAYPATLFLTGANDPRVDPMQSRKMTARLQAATAGVASAGPILLRTSGDTGHGAGTPLKERIAQTADVDAFLFAELGVQYTPVQPHPAK